MASGRFITFEGGEGAGKSTQAQMLAHSLARLGVEAVLTREPGGTRLAEALRAVLLDANIQPRTTLSEVLLFYAARADHLGSFILPALNEGKWVICDRFSDSTRAYQGAAGNIDGAVIETIDNIVVGPHRPDLTFMLDVDPEVGLRRAVKRTYGSVGRNFSPQQMAFSFSPDRFEALDLAFHMKVRESFLRIASADPTRCIVVDSSQGITRVAEQVMSTVAARFQLAEGASGQ
jgi:dTMP kinase